MSLELVFLVGSLLFAIVLVIVLQSNIFGAVNTELSATTVSTALDQIVEASERVYKQGTGAKTQIRIQIPNNVKSTKITGAAIAYTLNEGGKNSTIAVEKTIQINGSLPINEGSYTVAVEKKKNYVKVSY